MRCYNYSPLLPTTIHTLASVRDQNSFAGRFCSDWRLLPTLATLCAAVGGVVFSLVYQNPYAAIPFGVVGLMSLIGFISLLSDTKRDSLQGRFCKDWRLMPTLAALCTAVVGVGLCLSTQNYYAAIPFGAVSLFSLFGLVVMVSKEEKKNAMDSKLSCRERFCKDWRIIPALVALAACVMGVVLCVMWQRNYLAIPFAAGALCSIYLLSLTYDFRQLKTFQESNEKLEETSRALKGEVRVFSAENWKLQQQVSAMTATAGSLKATLAQTENQRLSLEESAKVHAEENEKLKVLIAQQTSTLQTSQQQLDKLSTNLSQASQNDQQRAANLLHVTQVLATTQTQVLAGLTSLNKANPALDKLGGQAELLKQIESFMKNREGYMETMLKEFATYQQAIGRSTQQMEAAAKQVAQMEEIRRGLEAELAQLSATRTEITGAAGSINTATHQMLAVGNTLATQQSAAQREQLKRLEAILAQLTALLSKPRSSDDQQKTSRS